MKIAKWGDSLAVRLPQDLVERLSLQDGDEVEVTVVGDRHLRVSRDTSREAALARMWELSFDLPPDYRFDRQEAHGRAGFQADPDAA